MNAILRFKDSVIGALDAGTGKLLWRFDSMEGESKKGRKWANTDCAFHAMANTCKAEGLAQHVGPPAAVARCWSRPASAAMGKPFSP